MKELSKREKSFIKKLEKMKKDVEVLSHTEAVNKFDKAIKMLSDGWSEDDSERDRAVNEAIDLYTEAMSDKLEQLVQKSGINREQPSTE